MTSSPSNQVSTQVEPAGPAAGWTADELHADPHANVAKQSKVQRMFASIAHAYDLNNRLHSMWRDQAWRRFAVRAAGVSETSEVLDAACGTGDLTQAFAKAGASYVVGMDYTPEMLDVARHKRDRLKPQHSRHIEYLVGDAQDLPFEDASFDVVSIAFGIRNVQEPAKAINEFARVLKPGGRLVVLEFAQPTLAPVRWFNTLYCQRIMPITATLISRDRSGAYKYLPRSVETFLSPQQLAEHMQQAGLAAVTHTPLSLGICVCTVAARPDNQ